MKTSKHTQGEWTVEYDGFLVIGGQVCDLIGPDYAPLEEKKANARLAAAAPEMLRVLYMVLDVLPEDVNDKTDAAIQLVNQIINKAEGR